MADSRSARFTVGSLLKFTFLLALAFGFLRMAYEIESHNGDSDFAFVFAFYGFNLLIAIVGGTVGGLVSGKNGVSRGVLISVGTVWTLLVTLVIAAIVVGT